MSRKKLSESGVAYQRLKWYNILNTEYGKRLIKIKRRILPLLISALLLTSCAEIPIGDTSSQTPQEGSKIVLEPSGEDESAASEEASAVVSEQSNVTEEPSEAISEPEREYEYSIDIEQYLEYICPEDDSEFLLLVNYDHRLTDAYAPNDLTVTSWTRSDREGVKLRKNCTMALDAFLQEAKLNGVADVTVTSGYRSYSYQKWLFNYYVEVYQSRFKTREECEKYVMTFSCREGCSEHQTGLALDMHNLPSAEVTFADSPAYAWLEANAHKFGFILRFPKDKEDITGISFEPWHYRFVGRKAATYIYEHGLCLEEYYEIINSNSTTE